MNSQAICIIASRTGAGILRQFRTFPSSTYGVHRILFFVHPISLETVHDHLEMVHDQVYGYFFVQVGLTLGQNDIEIEWNVTFLVAQILDEKKPWY